MLSKLIAPTEEQLEDDVIDIKEESDETEPLKMMPDPGQPTEKQLEEHRTCGHTPYRTWCKWCNMGMGRGHQHRMHGAASTIALIGLDYFFMTAEGLKKRKELEYPMNPEGTLRARTRARRVTS